MQIRTAILNKILVTLQRSSTQTICQSGFTRNDSIGEAHVEHAVQPPVKPLPQQLSSSFGNDPMVTIVDRKEQDVFAEFVARGQRQRHSGLYLVHSIQ